MSVRYCENPFSREEFLSKFPSFKKVDGCLNDDNAWKEYYVPYKLESNAKNASREDKLALKCFGDDKRKWFQMTYRNVMNYGTQEQKDIYHEQRKRYLCNLMTRATANFGFCFKMMGSDSAASDVDISILPKMLYPEPSAAIDIVRNFYTMHQDSFVSGDTPSRIFDANIYATNFTQVFENPVPPEVEAAFSAKKIQLVSNPKMKAKAFDMPCFKDPFAEFVDATSIYIPCPDNSVQMGFATYKLAKTYDFKSPKFVESITSVLKDEPSNAVGKTTYKQLMTFNLTNILGSSFKNSEDIYVRFIGVDGADNTTLGKYGDLIKDYYEKRMRYLQSGSVSAIDVVNTLSEATLYEDEAYHTQGAFMDINVRPAFNFKLQKHEFRDSILENLGFISEYGNLKKHTELSLLQRLEKINKYFERICSSLIEIWTNLSQNINATAFPNAQRNVRSRVDELGKVQKVAALLNDLRKDQTFLTNDDISKIVFLLIKSEPRFTHLSKFVMPNNVVDEQTFNVLCRVIMFETMNWLITAIGITHTYSLTIDDDEQFGGKKRSSKKKKVLKTTKQPKKAALHKS